MIYTSSCLVLLFLAKVLVTGDSSYTEIIDLINLGWKQVLYDERTARWAAFGALIENQPVIGGGYCDNRGDNFPGPLKTLARIGKSNKASGTFQLAIDLIICPMKP